MAFTWTTIHVKDLPASIDFYKNTVGLRVLREVTSPTGNVIAFMGYEGLEGQTQIELIYNEDHTDYPASDQISIGFSVDDLEAKQLALATAGIAIYGDIIQPNPHVRFLYVKDPDGVSVQFVEFM